MAGAPGHGLSSTSLGPKSYTSPHKLVVAVAQALWVRATQAGTLREEVEAVRAAGQAAALAATREQLEQWDVLMSHSASLESENRRLRCADTFKASDTQAKQDAGCHICQSLCRS